MSNSDDSDSDPPKKPLQVETLPPELRKLDPQTFAVAAAFFHSGPLPPPSELAEYDRTFPGLGRDIVTMAKAEQDFRHECGRGELKAIGRGQWMGLACFVSALGTALAFALSGHPVSGAGIATAAVTAFAAVFIFANHVRNDPPPPAAKPQASRKTTGKKKR